MFKFVYFDDWGPHFFLFFSFAGFQELVKSREFFMLWLHDRYRIELLLLAAQKKKQKRVLYCYFS